MSDAISMLKTTRSTFYRWLRTGRIRGMKVGRQWRFETKEIERFLKGEEPRIALRTDISPLIRDLEKRNREAGSKDTDLAGETDLEHALDLVFRLAVAMRATTIHLAPSWNPDEGERPAKRTVAVLRFRIDGVLHVITQFDARLLPPLIEQSKILASCNPDTTNRPQDGRLTSDYGGSPIDLRFHFLPAIHGESVVVRILFRIKDLARLEEMDYTPEQKERIFRWLQAPNGIMYASGPAGCGKTTLLYACLGFLNRPELKIMTVEDPVEYAFPWLVQIQARPDAGLTIPVAIRSMLRSDADIMMVGEIRDRESAQLVHAAAITGHLVLSSLHAEEAAAALVRLVDIGLDPFIVAEAKPLVVAQRLVRMLCPHCKEKDSPGENSLRTAERLARSGGLDWASLPRDFRRPAGCDRCHGIGYLDRNLIAETLVMTPAIGAALRRGSTADEIRTIAVGEGMTSMAAHGILRAARGDTSLAEIFQVLGVV